MLPSSGFPSGITVRILIEALYKDDAAKDQKLQFPLDFVIK